MAQWYIIVTAKDTGELLGSHLVCLEDENEKIGRRIEISKKNARLFVLSDSYFICMEIEEMKGQ